MKQTLIGRAKEIQKFQKYQQSRKSEFVALYGRRRVGKTYLVRQVFQEQMTFQLTGLANVGKKAQLAQFYAELLKYFPENEGITLAKDWFTAFRQLIISLEKKKTKGKKVIFLDEVPWLGTKRSGFIQGLGWFWNSWAVNQDIVLVVF